MDRYRILTLDGGGAWAVIEVMALIDLYGEATTGHEVLKQFDLVAANSGGSIVLGGLVEDMTLGALRDFFLSEEKRKSVFVRKSLHLPGLEKYDTPAKLSGLRAALPKCCDMPLTHAAANIPGRTSGVPVHLLIAGFDYDRNRGAFFRSAPATRAGYGTGDTGTATMAEAIHASSNAPIRYFDKPAELPNVPGKRYWDGALSGSNNPVLIGVSEAIVLGQSPSQIAALAIGTGTVFLPFAPAGSDAQVYYQTLHQSGLTTDLEKLAGAILDDPPDVASFVAHVLTGGPPVGAIAPADSCVVRMSPMISPIFGDGGAFALPAGLDSDSFDSLVKMDMDAVEQDEVDQIQHFAQLWLDGAVLNQAVRMGANLTPEIGQATYPLAKQAWEELTRSGAAGS